MKTLRLIPLLAIAVSSAGCAYSSVALRSSSSLVLPDQDHDSLPDGFENNLGTDPRPADGAMAHSRQSLPPGCTAPASPIFHAQPHSGQTVAPSLGSTGSRRMS
jgi:hypothetical protein